MLDGRVSHVNGSILTFVELLQKCPRWATPGLQKCTKDMVILLPIVQRLLPFLPTPEGQAVDESYVRYVTVFLKLATNALSEIRHCNVKRIDGDDFGSLRV